jgi:Lar family restriction alleviation protein
MSEQRPKLKPCPFCGSDHLTVKQNLQLNGMTFITCDSCGLVASFRGNKRGKKTISSWNQRVTHSKRTSNPREKNNG